MSQFKDVEAMMPLIRMMFKEVVKESITESFTGDLIPFLVKANDLHDKPTVAEAMDFMNVKSRTTWEKKVKEYKLKVIHNKIKNCKVYKKEEILKMYVIESKFAV